MTRLTPRPTRQDGWQPIETAPKDGTHFLALTKRHRWPVLAYWRKDEISMEYSGIDVTSWVTHWMPLPAPPETAK